MKDIFILWLLLCMSELLHAQILTIKDMTSRSPLEWVTVSSTAPKAYVITDFSGSADISRFTNCDSIKIDLLGYKSWQGGYSELKHLGYTIFLEANQLNLEEVVVSGTRWRQSSYDVPAKVISISAKEVALQNPQTAADLLGISGKVYIQKSQQGGGSPMIRGFAANRLLYTIDGVRMNNAIFRSGNLQNVISLDPFAIEKTEVVFGPGSVIYGSDAIGGVMSFSTYEPQFSLHDTLLIKGKTNIRYASANQENTGHVHLNIGLKKWAFFTSLSGWDYGHLKQGRHGPEDYIKPYFVTRINGEDRVQIQEDELLQIPSAYTQVNFMQKARFRPSKDWDFQYGLHYSETSPYGRYDRHNRTTAPDRPRYGTWEYGPQKWQMHNLNITQSSENLTYDQMTFNVAAQRFEESRMDRNINEALAYNSREVVLAYSANLDFIKTLNQENTIYYGLEYIYNEVLSEGNILNIQNINESNGPARYPTSTWTSISAYTNHEYKPTQRLTIQGGLRYSHYIMNADFSNNLEFYPFVFTSASLNQGSFNGSLGAVYRPSETVVINTNLGTGFRAPNVDDLGKIFDSEPGAVTVPNSNLKAEYAYNADIGIAKIFNNRLKCDVSTYYTYLNNAMVRRNFQLNGQDSLIYNGVLSQIQAIQNAADAYVYGLQASIELKVSRELKLTSDLNYQVGEEELSDGTKSPSRHAAPLYGKTSLRYASEKITIQLNSIYQAERAFENLATEEQAKDEIYAKDENGNNYAPAWYTLNLKLKYQVNDFLDITTGIENISDRRYRPYSSGISGPGRNMIFALNFNF